MPIGKLTIYGNVDLLLLSRIRMNTKLLKQKILDLAIRGKLTQQLKSDGTAADLLKEICDRTQEKTSLRAKRGNPSPQTIIPLDKSEAPFEIPANWEWVRLGDVASLCLGKMLDKSKNKGTYCRYLRNVNIRWGEFDFSDIAEMKFEDVADNRFLIKYGDLVMCEGGEPGRCAVWTDSDTIHFQKALHRIRFFNGFIPKFYQYLFFFYANKKILDNYFTGSTIKHLTGESLREIPIPLPPLAEQQRIVAKIEEAFAEIDSIENNKELLKTHIKQTRQKILDLAIHGKLVPQNKADEPASILLERITRDNPHYEKMTDVPFEIPESWEWVKLGDVVKQVTDFVASGSFASLRENVKYYKEENYAILVRTLDFRNNFENDLTYTDKHGYEFLSNSNLFGGELLLSNIGSIGKVFIVPKLNKRMTLAPNSIMVRHYDDSQRDWLYYFFLSPVGQEVLLSISSSTTQAKFNKTQLKGVLVPLPPLAEQKRIVDRIEEIFASLDEISLHLV